MAVQAARTRGLDVTHGDCDILLEAGVSFDLILMIMTVEHVAGPRRLLRSANQLLKPGGRLVVVTDNSGSLDARLFRSGFWGGYHFPRHWNLFDKRSLGRLAERSGFEISSIHTAMSPVNWVYSIHNLLVGLGAPRWLINRFTLHSIVTLGVFTILDGLLNAFGRGSILHAIFHKPAASQDKRVSNGR